MLTFVCTSISCAYDSVLQCLYSLNCSFLFILVKMRLPFGSSCFGLEVPGWELDGFPSYTTISISWTLSCWRMRTGIETLMPRSCFSSVVSFLHMRFREGVILWRFFLPCSMKLLREGSWCMQAYCYQYPQWPFWVGCDRSCMGSCSVCCHLPGVWDWIMTWSRPQIQVFFNAD